MDYMDVFNRQIYPKLRLEGDCMIFQGAKTGKYGSVRAGGRKEPTSYAHRLAYMAFNGPIPEGQVVMHSCNNPLCCSFLHLHAGTQQQNLQQMHREGRWARTPGLSGLTGVYCTTPYWQARGKETLLYHGKDFFEAVCARKSWESNPPALHPSNPTE